MNLRERTRFQKRLSFRESSETFAERKVTIARTAIHSTR